MTLFRIGWRKIRKFVLKRDGFRCAVCKKRSAKLTVHHIKPFCFVLKHDIPNLISLCSKCHTKIHRGLLEFNLKYIPKSYAPR
ncbi:MAG TPA: HNH endonuclease [Candidatus Aquilonibacter sp.]|nr:HNH endonuclease [Candidatus Aquilonibacter sp.]